MAKHKVSTRDNRRALLLSQSSGSIGSKKLKSKTGKREKYITENLYYPSDVDSDQMQGHYIMFFINTVITAKLHGPLKPAKNVATVDRGKPWETISHRGQPWETVEIISDRGQSFPTVGNRGKPLEIICHHFGKLRGNARERYVKGASKSR